MQRGSRAARRLRQFGNVDLDTTVQRVPGSDPGASTNKIKRLEESASFDLPKFRRWEDHGKIGEEQSQRLGRSRQYDARPPIHAEAELSLIFSEFASPSPHSGDQKQRL
jgi:hypothetical protein